MATNPLLEKLRDAYAKAEISHPHLKAVTLAQWLLESGRATSKLATDHLNFGGLKFRKEMTPFATKVRVTVSDGPDDYCKFASLDKFIEGYWAFINRAPYKGWKDNSGTAEAFIRFIGPIYCPPNKSYAAAVLKLVPEAAKLLAEAAKPVPIPPKPKPAPTPPTPKPVPPPPKPKPVPAPPKPKPAPTPPLKDVGTIVLDPGHGGTANLPGSSQNNATSASGVKEKTLTLQFCTILRDELVKQAAASGKKVNVVLTRTTDKNVAGADRAGAAFANKAKLFLSIHFNGMTPTIRGTETYVGAKENGNINFADDMVFAKAVQAGAMAGFKALGTGKDRGVKPDTETKLGKLAVLSDFNLGNTKRPDKCRAALLEVEFITNPDVDKLLISGPDAIKNRTLVMASVAKAMLGQLA